MISAANKALCRTCRTLSAHTSRFPSTSRCLNCPKSTIDSAAHRLDAKSMSHVAIERRVDRDLVNAQIVYDTPPQYSEEQLKALYEDLFASPLPHNLPETVADPPGETLEGLRKRFNLELGQKPVYKAAIDHVEQAVTFISANEIHLPKLGLVLDSEWEILVNTALDARDMGYALVALGLMTKSNVDILQGLDDRVLAHDWLLSSVERFATMSDQLTKMGYPLTPERSSSLIRAHLRSVEDPSLESVKSIQNLLHKLEAQGTPPSQSGYTHIMRAYLELSKETRRISETNNPSAAIAAVHDLYTHMRYVAHPTPSLETYSLVISACSRGNDVKPLRALELLREIREGLIEGKAEFLRPSLDTNSLVACYNAAIRACARSGHKFTGDAFRLARELVQRDGIPVAGAVASKLGPDRATLSALMHSAKRTGDLGRTRWILAEAMRAQAHALQQSALPSQSEIIVDEEIMVCGFQAYSAFRPSFNRGSVQEVSADDQTGSQYGASESIAYAAQPPHSLPQSTPEILFEADTLFSRIISKRSGNPDLVFTHVPLTARILNAYLEVYLSHAPLRQTLEKYSTVYKLPKMPEPNIYTFISLLERLARASKADRQFALAEAKKVWEDWLGWITRADSGHLDPVIAEVTPRGIERAWAAIIKVHSLCDEIDAALSLLREFIAKYPPINLKYPHQLALPSPRTPLEHAPPTNPTHSISDLLAAPIPRAGLLVRFTTPEQVMEPGIPPHLLFSDLALLHHRLVARHSHRRADIAFVTWACKSYELQIKKRRKQHLGQFEPEPNGERDAAASLKSTLL